MMSNNSPINKKGKKNFSPPIKIGKKQKCFGKNSFGENLGGGEKKKTHKLNLKTKLRIHMKKNIISFNKCKLDTM